LPKITRRQFVQAAALAPLVLAPGPTEDNDGSAVKPPPASGVFVLQTWATETQTLLSVVSAQGLAAKLSLNSTATITQIKNFPLEIDRWSVSHILIDGLNTIDFTRIEFTDIKGKALGHRLMRGLDLQSTDLRLAIGTCSHVKKASSDMPIWDRVQNSNAQAFIYAGDLVYANSAFDTALGRPAKPKEALEKYIASFALIPFYRQEKLIPTYCIWDDHDYGWNNGGITHPHKAEMTEMFRLFFPIHGETKTINQGPGLSFCWSAFGMDFFFLDDRSFYQKGHDQWGREQWQWFEQRYLSSSRPCWIINGTTFLAYWSLSESVEKSPLSLNQLRDLFRRHLRPTLLVSGDVHYSQLQEIDASQFGRKIYELTSSCLHSSNSGSLARRTRAEGQLYHYGDDDNFVIVDVLNAQTQQNLDIHFQGKTQILKTLSIQI
jgi:alkaline phosphatase D